jgi:periplasmic divalent cation tolerance protein
VSQAPEPSPGDALLVLVTVPDPDTGARIGRTLVEERLAACVNVLSGLRSLYTWEGKVCDETEALCIVKTRRSLFGRLRERMTALHPYQVPEIIGFELAEGNAAYLRWILEATS